MKSSRAMRNASLAIVALGFGYGTAFAQPIGTFSWQQQPYCNVIILTVVQIGGIFQLDGTDDQCGAARKGSASGIAFLNPDGTIGLGLTLVTNSGGTGGSPLHIDATIQIATVSGTWRDNTGSTGPFVFVAGAGTGGPLRPTPIPTFLAGLAAGNARVTGVGTPTAPQDAANKSYVDAGQSAVRAQLFQRFIMSGAVGSTGLKASNGPFTSSRSAVGAYSVSYNVTGLGIPTTFTPPLVVATPDQFCTGGSAQGSWSLVSSVAGAVTAFALAIRVTNSAGAAVDCGIQFLATFQPAATLPPASDAPPSAGDGSAAVTCWNTPNGAVCK